VHHRQRYGYNSGATQCNITFVSDINGIAVADLTPNIIASAGANINGNAQYLIDAELVGENWTVVPEGTNIWLQRG